MSKYDRYINILLHGLFFMEFDACKVPLTVTAPFTEMHRYCCGVNGFLTELSGPGKSVQIDLRSKLTALRDGGTRSFTGYPQIPQFSKQSAETGGIVAPGAFRLLLRYPDEIIPLRCGSLREFDNVADDGPVKRSIMNCCATGGDQFSLVTCLRYQAEPSYLAPLESTYCFYAEHTCRPNPNEMNKSYSDAGAIFSTGFQLRLKEKSATPVAPGSADERSLAELLNSLQGGGAAAAEQSRLLGINVANCVQFGVNP